MRVDDITFGTGPIGSYAADGDPTSGSETLTAALAAGLRRFDSAPSYGDGTAESLLGAALASTHASHAATVATKVGRTRMTTPNPYARPLTPDAPRGGGGFDFTGAGVRASLAASLRRLRREHVDIAFLHDPELAADVVAGQAIPALVAAREEGQIASIGAASTSPDAMLRLAEHPEIEHVMIAAAWTLTRRDALPLLGRCADLGVRVHAAAPFDSGLLAQHSPDPAAPYGYRAAGAADIERARALAVICERHGVTLPQAALCFPLRHPAVSTVVVGMRSPQEVADNVALLAGPVPDDVFEEIDHHLATEDHR
ncbi:MULTISPECIES: aldo/keto reductase [unclassified Nocardioides]|uniref:aldo/keto reductase n=1 Tax=unclassified Nocardioides TaxID=2615069 RepID=UPI00360E04C1